MFDLEKQIAEWRKEMLRIGLRPEALDELETHVRERAERLKSSGTPELEAFQTAIGELGDGRTLKKEFAKVRWQSFWQKDRLPLNLIAIWFIIAGANALTSCRPFIWGAFGFDSKHAVMISILLVFCSQIFLGIGLLRRREGWRKIALGWSCFLVGAFLIWGLNTPGKYRTSLCISIVETGASGGHYKFLGLWLPLAFQNIISWVNIGVLLLACFHLTRANIRKSFQAQRAAAVD